MTPTVIFNRSAIFPPQNFIKTFHKKKLKENLKQAVDVNYFFDYCLSSYLR